MGRHSAPDDEPDDAAVATATLDLGPAEVARGRHAQPGDDAGLSLADSGADEQRTQMIAVVDPDVEFDDIHTTDEIVPPPEVLPPEVVPFEPAPVEPAPAEPSKADRKAAKTAEKERQAAEKAAEKARQQDAKAAAAAAKAAAKAESKSATDATATADAAQPAEPKVEPKAEAEPRTKKKKRDGETDTQADLRVLRENSAVRARSIAAVLVSFLLYTVAMIVIGQTAVYLLWIWVPIVVAGVLVGVVLDLAHRPPKGSEPAPPLEPMG